MNKTSIAWTDYTSNPLRAERVIEEHGGTVRVMDGHYCEKVGPGCANCYASAQNARGAYPRASTGLAYPANPPGSKYDAPPVERRMVRHYLNERELLEWQKPKYAGKRCFAFDMTDLFGEWVPDETLARIWMAMARSPLTFQILTKRPERMRDWARKWADLSGESTEPQLVRGPEATAERHPSGRGQIFAAYLRSLGTPPPGAAYPTFDWMEGPRWWPTWPMSNVWLGVTCENQYWADRRIPVLLDTPAAVRFVSYEPALGPVRLACASCGGTDDDLVASSDPEGAPLCGYCALNVSGPYKAPYIDWVIVGGESGDGCRPMSPEWARSVRDQCAAAGVSFFMKQDSGPRPGMQGRLEDELWNTKEFPDARR